jgi:Flp pilus assembly protein TadG
MDRKQIHRQLCLRAMEDERGVSLIIVAIMILVLTAMSSLVLDYGVVWLGRHQAQNAADAGALAGVQALAKDDSTWTAGAALNSVTDRSANGVAQVNKVLGATPGTEALAECPTWMTAPANVNCVRVNVYRDGTHGSTAMPVFFATLLGQTSQNIRATATAQVMAANGSGCFRPWFIPDLYTDADGNGTYNSPPDTYTSPGYDVDAAPPQGIGSVVTFHSNGGPSSWGQLDVGSGGNAIRDSIRWCYSGDDDFFIGDTVATKPGATMGPEAQGINDLLTWDPDSGACSSWSAGCVHWDGSKKEVLGGCSAAGNCSCGANPCPYGAAQSPRIVQAAICNPTLAACNAGATGNSSITITNILSFYIVGCNSVPGTCTLGGGGGGGATLDINAILIGSAGEFRAGPTAPGASFVTVQMLVR